MSAPVLIVVDVQRGAGEFAQVVTTDAILRP
jgi:cobyric acid synthase